MRNQLELTFLRIAASGIVSPKWFLPSIPDVESRAAKTGELKFEIVSHCWNYSHFLAYQLSSLVLFPPTKAQVTMTVFYSLDDADTCNLLRFFGDIKASGVRWNWQSLPKERLFRRAIGRNQAALASEADWVWFTDCDVLFREGCLDSLAILLQGRQEALLYPKTERITPLLADSDPILAHGGISSPRLLDIDDRQFSVRELSRATGPMQITHGDVVRACGYCDSIQYYQQPASQWCKAYEDRAFRWLLRSQGVPIPLSGVYRIRHVAKGRYTGGEKSSELRTHIRMLQSWWREGRKS